MNDPTTLQRALLLELLDSAGTVPVLARRLGEPERATRTAAAALAGRGLATIDGGRVEAPGRFASWTGSCRLAV